MLAVVDRPLVRQHQLIAAHLPPHLFEALRPDLQAGLLFIFGLFQMAIAILDVVGLDGDGLAIAVLLTTHDVELTVLQDAVHAVHVGCGPSSQVGRAAETCGGQALGSPALVAVLVNLGDGVSPLRLRLSLLTCEN